ncbi:hypothetical protein AB0C02_33490 [Micromonospora sp. NPDC048999]|uniref:hypothetical protein n=1 Tax=Micromonospora sp. NPDC048999 TaxID=3155391 RepID=UPI0033F01758
MNIDDLSALYDANETLLTALAILAGLGLLLAIARRIRRMQEHRLTLLVANILTILAAALATMVSASGMWKFFTDVLGSSPLRIVFFAYIEVALFASALLARARLLCEPEKGSTGVDGVAVWVLAGLTASLSALDADTFREVCLRLVAPLVAAWMWERALAAERSARLGRTATGIRWAVTLERIFVWLRLAEAKGRDVSEVDRARRRARLGRARLNLHLLQNKEKTAAWRLRHAHNRVIRQAMQASEHIGLADLPEATNEREAIQMYMAALYGFVDATSPDAVAHLNAWRMSATTQDPDATVLEGLHNDAGDGANPERIVTTPGGASSLIEYVPRHPNGHSNEVKISRPGAVATPPNGGLGEDKSGLDERGLARTEPPLSKPAHGKSQPTAPPLGRSRHDVAPPDDQDGGDVEEVLNRVGAGGIGGDGEAAAGIGTEEDADHSAVEVMRRFWDDETAKGRIPTGAELSRAAGVPPSTGLGRRKRREWVASLPENPKTAAGTSR